MSCSFIVRSNYSDNITFRDIIQKLHELKDFDKYVDLKEASISKRVNDERIIITEDILSTSINEGYSAFGIDEGYIFVSFHDHSADTDFKNHYYIESRLLTGMGSDLWVAVASAIADITGGEVSSADGAWDGYCEFCGVELWNEYLSVQREKDIRNYS